MNTNFGELPDEIKFTIFALTTPHDVCSLRQTCKGFKDVLNESCIDEWIALRKSYRESQNGEEVTERWKEFIIENNAWNQCSGLITNTLIPPTHFTKAHFEDNIPIKTIYATLEELIKIVQDYVCNNLQKINIGAEMYVINERLVHLSYSGSGLKVGMLMVPKAVPLMFRSLFKPFTDFLKN